MRQIKDVMSRDVQVISPDATLAQAARAMRDGDFGMLPVGENDRLVGAISDRDIAVRGIAEGCDGNTKVRDVMSQGVCWAFEDEPVDQGAAMMSQHQVRRLLIVNRDKRLVGIVALGDLAVREPQKQPAAKALTDISVPG